MDLVIRIPERVQIGGRAYNVVDEHNAVYERHGAVGFGKFGAPLSNRIIREIEAKTTERPRLFVVVKRQGKFFGWQAAIKSVQEKWSSGEQGAPVPDYYLQLSNRPSSAIFLKSRFRPTDLKDLYLTSNDRPLLEVMSECRTSVMLVRSAKS
jgi:hypothetical protein